VQLPREGRSSILESHHTSKHSSNHYTRFTHQPRESTIPHLESGFRTESNEVGERRPTRRKRMAIDQASGLGSLYAQGPIIRFTYGPRQSSCTERTFTYRKRSRISEHSGSIQRQRSKQATRPTEVGGRPTSQGFRPESTPICVLTNREPSADTECQPRRTEPTQGSTKPGFTYPERPNIACQPRRTEDTQKPTQLGLADRDIVSNIACQPGHIEPTQETTRGEESTHRGFIDRDTNSNSAGQPGRTEATQESTQCGFTYRDEYRDGIRQQIYTELPHPGRQECLSTNTTCQSRLTEHTQPRTGVCIPGNPDSTTVHHQPKRSEPAKRAEHRHAKTGTRTSLHILFNKLELGRWIASCFARAQNNHGCLILALARFENLELLGRTFPSSSHCFLFRNDHRF
jgi:hypothetical protein